MRWRHTRTRSWRPPSAAAAPTELLTTRFEHIPAELLAHELAAAASAPAAELLDDVRHVPQLDVPLEAAQLLLGATSTNPQPPSEKGQTPF